MGRDSEMFDENGQIRISEGFFSIAVIFFSAADIRNRSLYSLP